MLNYSLKDNYLLQNGKYRIIRVLGQGGFGITYLAEQTMLGKLFAIKEFFIRDLCARDDSATVYSVTQSDMVDRYRQKYIKEAQIIARFNHPGIVRVSDIFEENDTVYYVMEYVEGENLDEIIKREGALPEERALGYIVKMADALDYIHQHNVNHLDIKPSNIMIRKADDEPILIDFGVSKQYDEHKDQTTATPPGVSNGYSPLEQYRPGGVSKFSPQADIYAMGATLYKMITGKTPPSASDLLNNGLPFPSGVSLNVKRAIQKAMQPRIGDRPSSIGSFITMTCIGKAKNIDLEDDRTLVSDRKAAGDDASVHIDNYSEEDKKDKTKNEENNHGLGNFGKSKRRFLSRKAPHQWAVFMIDVIICLISGFIVLLYYTSVSSLINHFLDALRTIAIYMVFNIIGFRVFHTYASKVRDFSFIDLRRVGYAMVLSCMIALLFRHPINLLHMGYLEAYGNRLFVALKVEQITAMYALALFLMWVWRVIAKAILVAWFKE